jgi:CDP-diacylglycerol--glycerol-3-phosphate 3-phosphatidyltransferase
VIRQSIPNALTLSRVALVPVMAGAAMAGWAWLAFAAFVIASITDWLDGFLARQWQVTSSFGAALDPVADKLLVITALVVLMPALPSYAWYAAMFSLWREVWVGGLREAAFRDGRDLSVSAWGKWKTAAQMLALAWLLCPLEAATAATGHGLLLFSSALALYSGFLYTKNFFRPAS